MNATSPKSKQSMAIETSCDPLDIALKSMFLGPQAENADWVEGQMRLMLGRWFTWRRSQFPKDGKAITERDQQSPEFARRAEQIQASLSELLSKFEQEIPRFSPRYGGHMFSEISLPALFGHFTALLHNPNNISGESSRVGVKIEDEAVTELIRMIGYSPEMARGHFTSGGTIANFEALVRARARLALWLSAEAASNSQHGSADLISAAHCGWNRFRALLENAKGEADFENRMREFNFSEANPWTFGSQIKHCFDVDFKGPVVLVPASGHYSWKKGASLLGFGNEALWNIELDQHGRLSISHLKHLVETAVNNQRPIAMIVSIAGTTELGQFDPTDEVQDYLDDLKVNRGLHIWHHVDAAYGGFFRTLDLKANQTLSEPTRNALTAISRCESVTLDPHKLGYVPFASGTFIARDRRDYEVKSFGAPYVQFRNSKDRGPFTIEGSRSAAGAAATWMIAKSTGLNPDGYGRILARTIQIRHELEQALKTSDLPIQILPDSESNLLCFALAREGESLSVVNQRTEKIQNFFSPESTHAFYFSKTTLKRPSYSAFMDLFLKSWNAQVDCDSLSVIRLCLMNPFFNSKETSTCFRSALVNAIREAMSEMDSARPRRQLAPR